MGPEGQSAVASGITGCQAPRPRHTEQHQRRKEQLDDNAVDYIYF